MKITFTIIAFLTLSFGFCQNRELNGASTLISSKVLDSLYVVALNNRFDLILSSGWHYVEMNEFGSRIKDLNVSDRFKFLTNEELIDLSIKKKKSISILRVGHKIVAKDTIDINFGNVTLLGKRKIHFFKGLRFKKGYFSISCGGTEGYKPDIRFVFDKKRNSWKIESNKFVKVTE
jgi:hypothetical protein